MAKYVFSESEKYGLWVAGGKKCFYCGEPLLYSDIWVDHILPESLLKTPEKLKVLIADYGIEEDFEINGYQNWIAAHSRCNRRKGAMLFEKGVAVYNISIAKSRQKKAEKAAQRIVHQRQLDEAFALINKAKNQGLITEKNIKKNLYLFYCRTRVDITLPEPLVITFGIGLTNIPLELTKRLSSSDELLEWLKRDLVERLSLHIHASFYYPQPTRRFGETLIVRLAFLNLNLEELRSLPLDWWKILSVDFFTDIYSELLLHDEWFEPFDDENSMP